MNIQCQFIQMCIVSPHDEWNINQSLNNQLMMMTFSDDDVVNVDDDGDE